MRREAPRDKCPGTFAPIANVFCFPCLLIDNGIKFVVCVCVCVLVRGALMIRGLLMFRGTPDSWEGS